MWLAFSLSLTDMPYLFAQSKQIDSLVTMSQKIVGKERIDVLNKLAYQWMIKKYDSCKFFAAMALQEAEKINYTKGKSEASIFLGIYEAQISGNRQKSLSYFKKGQLLAHSIKNHGLEGFAFTQTGNLYRIEGKYDSAFIYYQQSYELLKDSINPWHLSMLYRNMGKYYSQLSDAKTELLYLQRAWMIRSKLTDDAMKVDALVSLSVWYTTQSDFVTANTFIQEAEKFISRVGQSWAVSDFYAQKAMIYFHLGRPVEALQLLTKAKSYYSVNSVPSYVKLLNDIGEVLEEQGNHDASLLHYFEAVKMAEANHFDNSNVRAMLGIGRNYYRLKILPSAYQFAHKALESATNLNFKTEEATAYNLIGLIKKQEKKYEEAITFFDKALTLRQQLKDKKGEGVTLGNIGEALEGKGNLLKALNIQLQSLTVKLSIQHQSGLAWAHFDLGSVYTKLKEFSKASNHLDVAEKLAHELRMGAILINVYQTRRSIAIAQGKTKQAIDFSIAFEKLKDSVSNSTMMNRILSLETLYDLEKQNKEIQLLKITQQTQQDEITIQQAKLRQQQFTLVASIAGFLLLTSLAILSYTYYKKTHRLNRDLQETNEEIQTQSEELTEMNASLTNLNKEATEKQEEIQAQAEELIEANQSLTLINMELAEKSEELAAQSEELRESNEIISSLNENLESKVGERTQSLEQAYKELDTFFYRSSHDFRRPLTTFMGLAEVAKITVKDSFALDLFDKVKETAVNLDRMLIKLQSISDVGADQFIYKEVSLQTVFENARDVYKDVILKYDIRVSIQIDRINSFVSYPAFLKIIIENLLENAIQFRGSNQPSISLQASEKESGIQLIMQDNGQGVKEEYQEHLFEMFYRGNENSKGNGLGLYIVKKAVEKMSGKITFLSTYQQGTTVTIWFPHHLSPAQFSA